MCYRYQRHPLYCLQWRLFRYQINFFMISCWNVWNVFGNDILDKHEVLPALDYNLIKLIVVSIMIVLYVLFWNQPAELSLVSWSSKLRWNVILISVVLYTHIVHNESNVQVLKYWEIIMYGHLCKFRMPILLRWVLIFTSNVYQLLHWP